MLYHDLEIRYLWRDDNLNRLNWYTCNPIKYKQSPFFYISIKKTKPLKIPYFLTLHFWYGALLWTVAKLSSQQKIIYNISSSSSTILVSSWIRLYLTLVTPNCLPIDPWVLSKNFPSCYKTSTHQYLTDLSARRVYFVDV